MLHRFLTAILLVVLVSLGCWSCVAASRLAGDAGISRDPSVGPVNKFERMADSTVVLGQVGPDGFDLHCGAVFIDSRTMVSVAHCMDVAMTDEEEEMWDEFGVDTDVAGRKILFLTWRETLGKNLPSFKSAHRATILAVDRQNDLAVISAEDGNLVHSSARLADGAIMGDTCWTLGHTAGLSWSLSDCVISADRWMIGPHNVKPRHVLQTVSAAFYGNSGTGLWDEDGRLLSVVSYIRIDTELDFSPHPSVVQKFLRDEAVIE